MSGRLLESRAKSERHLQAIKAYNKAGDLEDQIARTIKSNKELLKELKQGSGPKSSYMKELSKALQERRKQIKESEKELKEVDGYLMSSGVGDKAGWSLASRKDELLALIDRQREDLAKLRQVRSGELDRLSQGAEQAIKVLEVRLKDTKEERKLMLFLAKRLEEGWT